MSTTIPPTQTPSNLAARLQLLEDERAIYHLLSRYGEALDYGLADQLVDLFTPTGSWTLRRGGVEVKSFTGHDELRSWAARHPCAPRDVLKHVVTNVQIRITGAESSMTSYFMRLDASTDRQASFIYEMGRYVDRAVRCGDGTWRFEERLVDGEDDRAHRVGR